jgi:prepilin-type N-terminal cleavage/methylation domain-containing protein
LRIVNCQSWNFNFKLNAFQNANCGLRNENSQFGNPKSAFQKGFTLIEVIVVIVILSLVSAITIYFLVSSLNVYRMTVRQKTLFDEGKLAMERMVREIRDARSITSPSAGSSGSSVTFTRTNATAQDVADENITFRLTGSTLEKVKASPSVTRALAASVTTFTVTRGAADDEINLVLTLSLGSGEKVTLQTKVYPKNLADSTAYKNFFQNWKEELSS